MHNAYLDTLFVENAGMSLLQSFNANFNTILNTSIKDNKVKENVINLVNNPNFGSISFLEQNLDEQLALDYIKQIVAIIDLDLDYDDMSLQLELLRNSVAKDNALINKSVVLVMIEVSKKSSYYWLPLSKGGSGKGEYILANMNKESRIETPRMNKIIAADGFGAAGACLGGAAVLIATGGMAGPAVFIGIGFGAAWASGGAAMF